MADYAIGDLQGCYAPLQRLLEHIDFDDKQDRLWFVGDLVNRGAESLAVLRFIRSLPLPARITLGNHDLHLLGYLFGHPMHCNEAHTFDDVLSAPDGEELGHWLRCQPFLYHDPELKIVMSHAGIAPMWSLDVAQIYAAELANVLSGANYSYFLEHMYGNMPNHLSDDLLDLERWRVICNYFTRMRFCDALGNLILENKGPRASAGMYPWYAVPNRCEIDADIVFGHWSALEGRCPNPRIHAIDTGCVWGGPLTALRLHDKKRFVVPGM